MEKNPRSSRTASKIKTDRELAVFSETQINTFFSDKVDNLDEALSVLDEKNKLKTTNKRGS